MTDSRLLAKWLLEPRMEELSDRAWRTFTGALMFSNEQGTDGLISRRSLRFLHPDGVDGRTLNELVTAGLFEAATEGALQVVDWTGMGQSTAADVEHNREQARRRQRAKREREKQQGATATRTAPPVGEGPTQAGTAPHSGSRHANKPRDVTRDVGQEGQDRKDRTGQDSLETRAHGIRELDWPVAPTGQEVRAS